MSQTKAQLVEPVGVVTATAMTVSGVLTATTYDGNITGAAVSIAQGKNLNVGVLTASGIGGDITGSATSITQGTNVTFGSLTATFVGDFTGTASSIMSGSNVTAGIVTASSFSGPVTGDITGDLTGNVTGTAGSITSGNNLWVGIATATLVGDGSNLTGMGSSAFTHQTITADDTATSIDLSVGNIITFNQSANTTVSFANTSEAMKVTLIRIKDESTTARTITWPDSVKWNGGSAPTLISNNHSGSGDRQQFQFLTRDTGVTWYGWESFKYDTEQTAANMWVWGCNQVGKLGLNSVNSTPDHHSGGGKSSPTQLPGTWEFTKTIQPGYQVEPSSSHAIAIKEGGTIWGWGNANCGQLGLNDSGGACVDRSSPTQIGTETTWITPLAGDCFSGGVKTDGTLWMWGYNAFGQLGLNNQTSISSPIQVGTDATWGTEVATTMGASRHMISIKTDGTLWMWGSNNDGFLGHNNTTQYSSPKQVGTDTTWSKLGGGYANTVGLKTDGTLWSWGANVQGNLGLNNKTSYSSPVQIGTESTWNNLSFSYLSPMATKTDGTLWVWGFNSNGQLGQNQGNATGDGGTHARSSPTQLPGTTWDASSLNEGIRYGAALKTDGTFWIWGLNQWGQLGQNDTNSRSSPVQIPGTTWLGRPGGAQKSVFMYKN